jgi:hypothetical protein
MLYSKGKITENEKIIQSVDEKQGLITRTGYSLNKKISSKAPGRPNACRQHDRMSGMSTLN